MSTDPPLSGISERAVTHDEVDPLFVRAQRVVWFAGAMTRTIHQFGSNRTDCGLSTGKKGMETVTKSDTLEHSSLRLCPRARAHLLVDHVDDCGVHQGGHVAKLAMLSHVAQ